MKPLRVTTDVRVLAVLRCVGEATVEGIYSRLWRFAAASTVAQAVVRLRRANRSRRLRCRECLDGVVRRGSIDWLRCDDASV